MVRYRVGFRVRVSVRGCIVWLGLGLGLRLELYLESG